MLTPTCQPKLKKTKSRGSYRSSPVKDRSMKTFLIKLRDVAISGFFALFPIYVVFLIFTKAWTHLTAAGAKISGIFGIKTMFGIHGGTALTGLLIITIWFVSGLLMRISFMNTLSRAMEGTLSKLLPGYATYK